MYKIEFYLENTTIFHIKHSFELTKKDFKRGTNISKHFDYQFLIRLFGERQIHKILKEINNIKDKKIIIKFNENDINEIVVNYKVKYFPETKEEKYIISKSTIV